MSDNDLFQLVIHIVPVVIALIVATVKIVSVIRGEIKDQVQPILSAIRDLWEHNASQDIKIDGMMGAQFKLQGEHDAITRMGGHHGERRSESRQGRSSNPA